MLVNKQNLVVREDREMGELGLMLEDTRIMDYPMVATDGLLVAHDILEHQRGPEKIGTIGDELVALGGIWYVRGRYGLIGQDSIWTAEQNIGHDIANMAMMYAQDRELHFVPKSESEHDYDESFNEIVEFGKGQFLAEWSYYDEILQRDMQPYWDAALQGLRLGYDMAEKRFDHQCMWSTFQAIREQVNNVMRDEVYEYQRFELTWERGEAHLCETWEDDE